jgi:hypothetical protein
MSITLEEKFHDLYVIAMQSLLTSNPNLKADQIDPHSGQIAQANAMAMLKWDSPTGAPMGAVASAPHLPDLVPQGAHVSSFGPQFAGWPEVEIRGVLSAVQEIVLAMAYSPTPEQVAEVRARLDEQIANLSRAYYELQSKKK